MAEARLIAGRYRMHAEFAAGGMAAIHFGRQLGAAGFARTVAIKRLHAHLARDPDFVAMFVDEAALASRIRHLNVVPTLDVVQDGGELFLVMEYMDGEALMGLLRGSRQLGERLPPDIAARIVCDLLAGLHAAHDATSDTGTPLHIVHRDVSPSNILVGADGVSRVLDFGVAKAAVRVSSTRQGGMKGKLRYMSPEQIADREVTRRSDVYAASVLAWELLVGEPLFTASNEAAVMARIMESVVTPPSRRDASLPIAVDAVIMRGLSRDPEARFPTAREMAAALEVALPPAGTQRTAAWVERVAAATLARRRALLAQVEASERGAPSIPDITPAHPRSSEITETAPGAQPATEVLDGPTQLVAARQPPREVRGRAPWFMAATVGLVGGMLLGVVLLLRNDEPPPSPAAPDPVKSIASEAASPEPPAPEPAPKAVTPSTALAIVSAVPSGARVLKTRPLPRECNPPYTIDAEGRRRVKRECL